MGRSCFLRVLLALALLALSFSHGFGRKMMIKTVEAGDSWVQAEATETGGKYISRVMMEVLDYQLDPGPNTNPKTGFISGPPPH